MTILGFSYRLNILVQNISDQSSWPFGVLGKTLFSVRGNRLNSNRKERLNVMYAVDRRLELQVVPEAPLLQVKSPLRKGTKKRFFPLLSAGIFADADGNVLRRDSIVLSASDQHEFEPCDFSRSPCH